MGDTTNVTINVRGVPEALRPAVLSVLDGAIMNTWDSSAFGDLDEPDAACWGGEASVGSYGEISDALDELIENGVEDDDGDPRYVGDFAYSILEDPKFEYDGTIYYHVPDVGSAEYSADAQGTIHIGADDLMQLVNDADNLDTLKAKIRERTGRDMVTAFEAYALD